MAWGDPEWFFSDVDGLISRLETEEPDDAHVESLTAEDREGARLEGRNVDWRVDSNYVVWVPSDQIMFMEGNSWNFGHARALYDLIRSRERPTFDLPACRLYRIDRSRVEGTRRAYEQDELDYQYGMEKPWEKRHVGSFFVQLLDGNHRALAAIAAGEERIPVIVGENYREDVKRSEWVKAPRTKRRPPRENPPPGDHESLGWEELDDAHHAIREERLLDELRVIERQGSLMEAMLLFDGMGYDVDGATDWYVEHQPDDILGEFTRVWFRFQ